MVYLNEETLPKTGHGTRLFAGTALVFYQVPLVHVIFVVYLYLL